MAKSKAGGTRAYIRGKIGADVYSIGKDGKGRKQQVVRSLAEQVKNPQTTAQMKGRMIMSTIMQAVANMSHIIDHSFDNVPAGQPSISEFIRLNYSLIKADIASHPSSGNSFGLNKYQEKGMKFGAYKVASGTAQLPSCLSVTGDGIVISTGAAISTYADLWTALGLAEGEFITIVDQTLTLTQLQYCRLTPDRSKAGTTSLSAANFLAAFTLEGNFTPVVTKESNTYVLAVANNDPLTDGTVIISKKQGAGYVHNDAVMNLVISNPNYPSDTALATYPTGEEMFLNGGEI